MKKYLINICLMAALTLTVSSCMKDYEAEFAAIQQRIEKLQAADKQTRQMILTEIDRLSMEISEKVASMEKSVYAHLDQKVSEVEQLIDSEMQKVRDRINAGSAKLGVSIQNWKNKIDGLIDSREADFRKSKTMMENELRKAISNGDAALQRRINDGLGKLESIQKDLPALCEKTQKRLDQLNGLADEMKKVHDELIELDNRNERMLANLDAYSDKMLDAITADISQYKSKELQLYYENITDAYSTVDNMYADIEGMTSDLQSMYDSMPDVEGLLSQAEGLFGDLEDLESYLSDFDTDQVQDLLDSLNEVFAAADDLEVDGDDLEAEYNRIMDLVDEIDSGISTYCDVAETMGADLSDLASELAMLMP